MFDLAFFGQEFLKEQVKNTGVDFYIGLHDLSTESKFTWVNGEELVPQNR